MRSLPPLSALLALLLMPTNTALSTEGEVRQKTRTSDIEERLSEWCQGFFMGGPADNPFERPVLKLRMFDMKDPAIPRDLVTRTQIDGPVPTEIARFQGLWIFPAPTDTTSGAIIITERLSPKEMALALIMNSKQQGAMFQRLKLTWNGTAFLEPAPSRGGLPAVLARVSPSGDALSLTFLIHLSEAPQKSVGKPKAEGWPMCFISAKHY